MWMLREALLTELQADEEHGNPTEHGKRDEARGMVAAIYGWFTEGFDTGDLKDAKARLDELNAWRSPAKAA